MDSVLEAVGQAAPITLFSISFFVAHFQILEYSCQKKPKHLLAFTFLCSQAWPSKLFSSVLWIRICRIRLFLGLPCPDPSLLVRIRILQSTSKKSNKNLDFYYFMTSFWLFSLNTYVPSKQNFEKEKFNFCWHLVTHLRKKQDGNRDPLVSGTGYSFSFLRR